MYVLYIHPPPLNRYDNPSRYDNVPAHRRASCLQHRSFQPKYIEALGPHARSPSLSRQKPFSITGTHRGPGSRAQVTRAGSRTPLSSLRPTQTRCMPVNRQPATYAPEILNSNPPPPPNSKQSKLSVGASYVTTTSFAHDCGSGVNA